jgi:pimeloyl-ACP methyl ester carboxylesterase
MRVWDALRGLQALRQFPGVDPQRLVLAGSGEMAVVALYAALLDGRVAAVILDNPPDTLNAPDALQGRPCFKEMINALRHADLPQTAACLWPTKLVLVGDKSERYQWTRDVYERMGGAVQAVEKARDINFDALV